MVRAFEVRARKKGLVCNLSQDLDAKLFTLQKAGWKILNVFCTECEEWDYPEKFKSSVFTIVAEMKDSKKEEVNRDERNKDIQYT